MKYFLVEYITYDGEYEFTERGVFSAQTQASAEKKAAKGRKFFTRYGWEEFCELSRVDEIPKADYEVLRKYLLDVDRLLHKQA